MKSSFFFEILLIFSINSLISGLEKTEGTLRVHGSAIVSTKPDQVYITFQITTLKATAYDSLQENNRIIANTVSALTQINLAKDEIGTANFNLAPFYQAIYHQNNNTNENIMKGYQTTNTLIIKSNKLDLAGSIIDTAIKSGIKNIQSVEFQVSPSVLKSLQNEMLELSVKDAKNKAELALKPLNGKIVGVKSMSLTSQQPSPRPVPMAFNRAAVAHDIVAKTDVYASNKDVNVGVDIEFYVTEE